MTQVEITKESHDATDARATSVTASFSSHHRGSKHGAKEGKKKRKSEYIVAGFLTGVSIRPDQHNLQSLATTIFGAV